MWKVKWMRVEQERMGERGEGRRKGEKKREWGIGFPLTVCLGSSTCSSLRSSHCGTSSTPGCLFLLLGPTCCGLVEARKTGPLPDHLHRSLSSNRGKTNWSDLTYLHHNTVHIQCSIWTCWQSSYTFMQLENLDSNDVIRINMHLYCLFLSLYTALLWAICSLCLFWLWNWNNFFFLEMQCLQNNKNYSCRKLLMCHASDFLSNFMPI